MSEIAQRKEALRREIIANRKKRLTKNSAEFTKNLLALVTDISPNRVMVFESFGTEPGTKDFIDQVQLPVMVPETHENHLSFKIKTTGEEAFIEPGDLLLIPALAVDREGNRLGRGKGYFDKTLETIPAEVLVFAVIYEDEFLASVPSQSHDRQVHGVVTELGIHKIK